ncbi:MAG: DUF6174 domain-containing protein [Cellulomonas sp.]
MVKRVLGPAVLCALAASACTGPPGPPPTPRPSPGWAAHASADYTYELTSSCGERNGVGRFIVTVVDGQITQIVGTDTTGIMAVEATPDLEEITPTIDELLARIDAAGAGAKDVTYDATTGVPTWVLFDPDPRATDDESCYGVKNYTPTS